MPTKEGGVEQGAVRGQVKRGALARSSSRIAARQAASTRPAYYDVAFFRAYTLALPAPKKQVQAPLERANPVE